VRELAQRIDHSGNHRLPVRAHGDPLVIQHRSLAWAVDGDEAVAALQCRACRGVQFFGGAVIPSDMQEDRQRAVRAANIVHDPRRIFELALDGLILALQAHHPHD
jgi:hypothetical protein